MRRSSSTSSFKWVGKFFLTLGILFVLTLGAGAVISALHGSERQSWRAQDYMISDFYKTEKDSCDVLFLGSSHMMCSLIPSVWEENAGGKCFNLGATSQLPDTTYHLLREGISRQHPKLVVVDLYYSFMQTEHNAGQSELIFKPMPLCGEKISMFFDLFTWEEQKKLLKIWINPFYRLTKMGMYQGEMALGLVSEAVDTSGVYTDRGFYSLGERTVNPEEITAKFTEKPEEYKPLSDTQVAYVKKMVALCKETDTSLLFISVPMAPCYLAVNPNYAQSAAEIKALCAELDVTYYDFNDAELFALTGLTDGDFADKGHTNQSGAEKFTDFLFSYLVETDSYCN